MERLILACIAIMALTACQEKQEKIFYINVNNDSDTTCIKVKENDSIIIINKKKQQLIEKKDEDKVVIQNITINEEKKEKKEKKKEKKDELPREFQPLPVF